MDSIQNTEAYNEDNNPSILMDEKAEDIEGLKEAVKEDKQKVDNSAKLEVDLAILENEEEAEKLMEAVIYVEGTVASSRLKTMFRCDNIELTRHIQNINNKYKASGSAIEILEVGESVIMTVESSVFGALSAIYDKKRKKKISKAMLQTLSIIAYKQPLTKAEIDDIRQSDSSYHLRALMEDGFIEWKGRKDYLDKRQTYGTTDKFLMHFGVNSIEELPKLRELKDLEFGKDD